MLLPFFQYTSRYLWRRKHPPQNPSHFLLSPSPLHLPSYLTICSVDVEMSLEDQRSFVLTGERVSVLWCSITTCLFLLEFRCIPDSLPAAPLPKRLHHQKKPLTLRPRKITSKACCYSLSVCHELCLCTEPSLLLEVGKGWMADPLTDCRQTLVANRMTSLKEERVRASRVIGTSHLQAAASVSTQSSELWDSTSTDTREEQTPRLVQMSSFCSTPISTSTGSFANSTTPLPCPSAGLLRVTGTANATIQEIAPPHSPTSNPFFSKMKELSEPSSTCGVNPFFSALQNTNSERGSCQPDSFSFSLAQFNSNMSTT